MPAARIPVAAPPAAILHAVPAPIPEAEGPEGKLLRALQAVMNAYRPGSVPTPRERAILRAAAHEAIDAYLVGKLAESGASGTRRT